MRIIRRRIAILLEADRVPAGKTTQVAAEIVGAIE